jgi:hypothetical protein
MIESIIIRLAVVVYIIGLAVAVVLDITGMALAVFLAIKGEYLQALLVWVLLFVLGWLVIGVAWTFKFIVTGDTSLFNNHNNQPLYR